MIASSNLGDAGSTAALALLQIASGFLISMGVGRFFGQGAGGYALAGSFDAVIEDLLQGLQLPVVGQYLGNGGSMVTPFARRLRGYSATAIVRSGATLGPGNANRATASNIAKRVSGYPGRSMVRRGGLGAAPAGYTYGN
jgi:hypothetical protein